MLRDLSDFAKLLLEGGFLVVTFFGKRVRTKGFTNEYMGQLPGNFLLWEMLALGIFCLSFRVCKSSSSDVLICMHVMFVANPYFSAMFVTNCISLMGLALFFFSPFVFYALHIYFTNLN